MTDHADLARHVNRFMRRMQSGLHARAQTFDTEGIGQPGALILLTLAENEGLSIHGLVDKVARNKSQVTRKIQELEAKGFVARSQSPDDARVSLLQLTQKGQAAVKDLRTAMTEVLDEILAPLSPEEQRQFAALFERF